MLRVLGLLALLFVPLTAQAQDAATLVADSIGINADRTLVADGNIEIFYRGSRLTAQRITYDRVTGDLKIDGPIQLIEESGTILLASQAELSSDLQDGILRSARLVLDQQLQLAANEITRVGGRYTALTKVVASSCRVCADDPTPLWEIRARRVVHDQQARQLYFESAQFRVAGVPVFYIPRLRMPDPSLDRATGFLAPRIRTTSSLGTGLKIPYFIALGDHRDLTLTPYYATAETATLEWRYRQAFRTGSLKFEGAVSNDDIRPDETRGYVFGEGQFTLPDGFTLNFIAEGVTDRGYLLDYGISDKDRLTTGLGVTRTRANEHISAGFYYYRSLRDGEDNSTLPTTVGDVSFHRRFSGGPLGGEAGLRFDLHGHRRYSDLDGDGRDVGRATVGLDWRRNWVLENGLVLSGMTDLTADFYSIRQDSTYPDDVWRLAPTAAVELRWPFVKTAQSGAVHVVEPVVQLVWARESLDDVPNEDSVLVEFDEGNLFSLSRFAGADRYERGLRANLGVSWSRIDPEGWSLGVTAGRVLRADDSGQFSAGTGLDGTRSDWLLSTQLATANGVTVTNRVLFDDGFDLTQEELRLAWTGKEFGLATSYVWIEADPAQDRLLDTSEWVFDAGWQISDAWSASFEGRYDFVTDRTARAGFGLQWRNECVALDLSLSRRFTSSTSVRPTTDFDLSVNLAGFGSGTDGKPYRRRCAR